MGRAGQDTAPVSLGTKPHLFPAWHLTHAHHPPQMAPPPVAGLGCLLSAESNRALLTLLEPEEAFKGSVRHPAPIT